MTDSAKDWRVAALDDIAEPGALEFRVGEGDWPFRGGVPMFGLEERQRMRAILVGAGGLGRELLKRIGDRWVVTVVDRERVIEGAESRNCFVSDEQVDLAGLLVYLR